MKGLALATAFACACGSADTIEPDQVARIVGATIATPDGGGTFGAFGDALALARGRVPAGLVGVDGRYTGPRGDVEHTYAMMACRDASGTTLPACGSTTDDATVMAAWTGRLARGDLALHVERHGMWTITNLQTWMPILDGNGDLAIAATFAGEPAPYELIVVEDAHMIVPTQMTSGTIHLELAIARGEAEAAFGADVLFDAMALDARLVLEGTAYRIDLVTGDVD